jgi:hypothetical protein
MSDGDARPDPFRDLLGTRGPRRSVYVVAVTDESVVGALGDVTAGRRRGCGVPLRTVNGFDSSARTNP